MKKTITIAIIVFLIVLIGLRLAGNKKTINELNKPVDRSSVKIPVTIIPAEVSNVKGSFSLPAVVKPVNEVDVTLTTSGKVKFLNFDLGSTVTKGQLIGSLDNSLKILNLQSAELLVEKTKADFERFRDLYQGKAATEVDYNNAKYNYENARTQAALLKQQIADGQFIAPISGTIIKKKVEEGEFVNIGASIATIVDVSDLKASVMVSESDVYKLKPGTPVKISSEVFPDKTFDGKVRYVSPAGDESHNYEVEVTMQNNEKIAIKSGTFIRVTFALDDKSQVLQIPKLALLEGTKNPAVFIAKDSLVEKRKIVLGRDLGESTEVLSGLAPGEKVITSGQINLSETSLIEIINSSSN